MCFNWYCKLFFYYFKLQSVILKQFESWCFSKEFFLEIPVENISYFFPWEDTNSRVLKSAAHCERRSERRSQKCERERERRSKNRRALQLSAARSFDAGIS